MQFFYARKTKQETFQMLAILCHLARQSQCHTQLVRHRYNVGFKHSILYTRAHVILVSSVHG